MIKKVEAFYDKDLAARFSAKDADDALNILEISEGVSVFEKLTELTFDKHKRPFGGDIKKKHETYMMKFGKLAK
jgi:hypothetical protein